MTHQLAKTHKARKRFGQNFLHDQVVIHRIVCAIAPREGEHLVEIGPGQGALTEPLADACKDLDVIELDRDLIPRLKVQFALTEGFRIHEGDALKFDFASLQTDDRLLRLVGNLPYNISTPLIFHLLSFSGLIKDMHFMLQKEVVDRLIAQPGEKNYGRLSVMARYYCSAENVLHVGPGAFFPPPKVDSAIVRLTPYTVLPYLCKSTDVLERVVRSAFSLRRKTLRNSLKEFIASEQLKELGIDPQLRAENVSLGQYVNIADQVHALS